MSADLSADPSDEGRDRLRSPSINFPQSSEEAFLAILHNVRKVLFERQNVGGPPLKLRKFAADAGFGTIRTQQQADWLNDAQSMLSGWLADTLDEIEANVTRQATRDARV